mgnify:CR=1 FL=1
MTTNIRSLDKIERATRQYLRAKAQAKITLDNPGIHVSGAPTETGVRTGGRSSRVEMGAILSVDAGIKAAQLSRELQEMRNGIKPYIWQMPNGDEKTPVRMYYLRGQGLAAIGRKLGVRKKTVYASEAVVAALQRGIEWLRINTDIK